MPIAAKTTSPTSSTHGSVNWRRRLPVIAAPPLPWIEQRPRLVNRDAPHGERVVVRAHVAAPEVAVAERFAHGRGAARRNGGPVDHGLLRVGWGDTRDAGPGEVLHPRRV